MSTATLPEISISPEVREFLKGHNAEAAFDKVRELVRKCYPDLVDMRFSLLDDPDVDDRAWCMIDITLAPNASSEERLARKDYYNGRIVEHIPFEYAQWFGLSATYQPG